MTGRELHELAHASWIEVQKAIPSSHVLAGYEPFSLYWDSLAAKVVPLTDVEMMGRREVEELLQRERDMLAQASMHLDKEGYLNLKAAISKVIEVVKGIVG